MTKLLLFRRGRYALAALALMVVVVAPAACKPTKNPLKPPPPASPCDGGPGACLKIEPDFFPFSTFNQTMSFKVTNLGPDEAESMTEGIAGGTSGNIGVFIITQHGCTLAHPVPGDFCTVVVQNQSVASLSDGFLVINSDNAQLEPQFGGHGVTAHLFGPG
jgi:hypothetical protein